MVHAQTLMTDRQKLWCIKLWARMDADPARRKRIAGSLDAAWKAAFLRHIAHQTAIDILTGGSPMEVEALAKSWLEATDAFK